MANKKKKTAAPVKTARVLPFDKPVMILYVMCCIGILSASVFSILTAVLAGDASGYSVGGDLILLTVAFVSVFSTLLMLNEGKQKAAAAVSVPQILYGVYRVIRELAAAGQQNASVPAGYILVQFVYFLLQPCVFTLTVALLGRGKKKDLMPKICVITSFLLIFLRVSNYLNILLNAFYTGSASLGIAYAMFPLCSVMYYVMYLYGIWKAGNVSFLREQPGYGR